MPHLHLDLPEILNFPHKLLPLITEFNNYTYFLIDGGRGSAKTHSVARLLLYISEQRKVRVICGREIQANIEESVHQVLKDLIEEYKLGFLVQDKKIKHFTSGSMFRFKGFREQGRVSSKGVEGVDILWIDEAQSITKLTLQTIIPTVIRKPGAKIIFTMNRHLVDDAVPEFLLGRPDVLHITINYFENPYCSLAMKNEAELMRLASQKDYDHIWMNIPLQQSDDYLFNQMKIEDACKIEPFGELYKPQRVMGIDFAAQGDDKCVATILDRVSNQHWEPTERIAWDQPDTMISTGKIVDLMRIYKPDVTTLDVGGMGKPVFDRLNELNVINLFPFDGGSTEGVDTKHHANIRALSYHEFKDWLDQRFLILNKTRDAATIKEMNKIKFFYRSNGCRVMEDKKKMKKELGYSPDNSDSLNMAIWGANHCLSLAAANAGAAGNHSNITRKSGSKRGRK